MWRPYSFWEAHQKTNPSSWSYCKGIGANASFWKYDTYRCSHICEHVKCDSWTTSHRCWPTTCVYVTRKANMPTQESNYFCVLASTQIIKMVALINFRFWGWRDKIWIDCKRLDMALWDCLRLSLQMPWVNLLGF